MEDSFGMSARDFAVARAADEKYWKRADGDRLFRRNILQSEAALLLRNPYGNEGGWSEESFSENGALLQTCIVESHFPQIAKSAFRNDTFNLWDERGRLQGDCRAHGLADSK